MKNKYLYITLFALLGITPDMLAQGDKVQSAPRLVVAITIDQLRSDYLEAYAPIYGSEGFKRLLSQGLVFQNASYGFEPVDRASALTTIATGTWPYYHGIVGREWLDKETLRPVFCLSTKEADHSAANIGTSTIGDEMKIATKGMAKVYAFAPTADAAVLAAGHAADGAAWIEGQQWATSSYFTPISQWLAASTKVYRPEGEGNMSVTQMALNCVEQAGIGLDDKTDLVNVVYDASGTDLMLTYMNLDKAVAQLINGVEQKLGLDRVLFVLTSTGYDSQQNTTDIDSYRIPTGTFNITRNAGLLNMYLGAIHTPASYVEACYKNQIFLNQKLLNQRNIDIGETLRRSQEFLLQLSGVRNVYTANQLLTGESKQIEQIRRAFNKEKCGDLIIEVAPGWKILNEDTNEQINYRAGYVPFPIVFFGANIKAGQELIPVTTNRIAPTIAKAIRIRAPNACSAEALF